MSYKNLEIWQLARKATISIHKMTLTDLPSFEMYEEGQQIRRSSKSVKSNIVEGYGRRRHRGEFTRFLDYAYASCLETIDHLETLWDTESLTKRDLFEELSGLLDHLSRKINRFTQSVESQHNRVSEADPDYSAFTD